MKSQIDSGYLKPLLVFAGVLFSPVILFLLLLLAHDPLAELTTRYGPKFSFEKFGQIQRGDSRDRVIELIGPPLSNEFLAFKPGDEARGACQIARTREEVAPELEIGSEWLHYSEPRSGGDFRWIIVYLDEKGLVTGTNDWITD